jgi:serine/threonine-protein kinase
VKLGDFGFIQSVHDRELMQEGTTLGTPDYISPEQARGEMDLDVRSDIYSLGASIFHMLTAKPLFEGSCSKVMRDHIDVKPPNLGELRSDLPKDVVRIIHKCLAKEPIDRYQTAEDLIRDLEMARIHGASPDGAIPATRSQILNVISAEKMRIAELENALAGRKTAVWVLLALALTGWALAGLALLF